MYDIPDCEGVRRLNERISFEDINQARKLLNLPERASLADVKEAYRRLAGKYHPDRGGDAEKMRQLNRAYRLMLFVCENYPVMFDEEHIKPVLLKTAVMERFLEDWMWGK